MHDSDDSEKTTTADAVRTRIARLGLSRKATAWVVGAAAVVAATSAAGIVANSPSPHPSPAAQTSPTKNALNAILLKHPQLGRPISALAGHNGFPAPSYAGDTGTIGVPRNAAALPAAPAGAVMTYVPGSVTGQFNLLQLGALALWAGCSPSEAPIAAAIAAAESGGNPGAQGDIGLMDGTWDWSQGLWQIRGLRSERGTGGLRDSLANASPEKNAKAMYTISSGCTNWTPWSTYMSGAYLPYLGMSKTAVLSAQQYQARTGSLPPFAGSAAPATVPAAAPARARGGSQHPSKHPTRHSTPKGGSSSSGTHHKRPATGATSAAPVPAPKTGAPKPPPNPVSSVISKLPKPGSSLPVKLPKPSTSLPVKLPKPSLPKLPVPSVSVSVP